MKVMLIIFVILSSIVYAAATVDSYKNKKWGAGTVGLALTAIGAICTAWLWVGPS